MNEIYVSVTKDGGVAFQGDTLPIGNYLERNSTRLNFEFDKDIIGEYRYLRFRQGKLNLLFLISSSFLVPYALTCHPGKWEFSVISSTSKADANGNFNGTGVFVSDLSQAVVKEGIETGTELNDEQTLIRGLFTCTATEIELPSYVTSIGDHAMAEFPSPFKLTVNPECQSIGGYAFLSSNIKSICFKEPSSLTALSDYAFYRMAFDGEVAFPASVSNWGQYVLSKSVVKKVSFGKGSNLKVLGSYAMWGLLGTKRIELPDGLTGFSSNTSIIKECSALTSIWIPNTMSSVIQAYHIKDVGALTSIELQQGFDASANFSNCTALSHDSIVAMIASLKDLTGQTAKSLTIGADNLAKLTDAEKAVATGKNWTLG